MPNPNAHEQPAEGGVEQIEAALQKQAEKQRDHPAKPQEQVPGGTKKDEK